METMEAIRKRASLKTHFSPRPVEAEKLATVLEAGRLAPSARNMQPWRFVVVEGKEAVENLVSRAFSEGNQVAKEAAAIIVVGADPNDDVVVAGKEYYLFDAGLAVENMLLAATDLGLVTHIMAGINEDELKRVLAVPDKVRFIAAVNLSYPAGGSYEEAAREKLSQRSRKEIPELTYRGQWGQPF